MTAPKFTPGPWVTNGTAIEQAQERNTLVVAYVEDRQNDDHRANARLIAAAPELYESLSDLIRAARAIDGFRGSPLESDCLNAIAKARGES